MELFSIKCMENFISQYRIYVSKLLHFLILFSCFSIAMPTAWLSISSALLLVTWLASGRWKNLYKIRNNPAITFIFLYLLVYLLSILYSSATWNDAFHFFLKYIKLLIIPIIVTSVDSKKIRDSAINAFLASIFLTLIISYFNWLHLIPDSFNLHTIQSPEQGFIVYKNRITQSILLAFAMYVMLCNAYNSSQYKRWIWFFLAALCFFDIFYLINGRSGQLIAICLALFFMYKKLGKNFLKYSLLTLVLCFIFKAQLAPYVPERLVTIRSEINQHHQNKNLTSSAGIRIEMYKNVALLIKNSPLIGYGVGSLKNEYEALVKTDETLLKSITNPHNQYLLVFFETGLLGGGIFILMLYYFWKSSINAYKNGEILIGEYMQGLILTFALGCFLNSLLMDAGEGRFFCLMAGLFLSTYSPQPKNKNDI